jgi:copper chaperone CopZ
MKAIHITATDIESHRDASLIEGVLGMTAGVTDVIASPAMKLVSVLYDEHKIRPRAIVKAIRSCGYDAHVVRRAPRPRASARAAAPRTAPAQG